MLSNYLICSDFLPVQVSYHCHDAIHHEKSSKYYGSTIEVQVDVDDIHDEEVDPILQFSLNEHERSHDAEYSSERIEIAQRGDRSNRGEVAE